MRVAVVTHYFPTSVDPWAGHSAYQTLRLLASRCELHVFYPYPVYPGNLTPRGRRGTTPDPTWRTADVTVTYLPYVALPFVSRPLNGFTIARQLLPHVRRWHPDIVLNYVVYPNGYAAVRIAKALRVPAIVTAIGSDLNRIADPLCKWLTRSALRQANEVVTVSQDLCNTARQLGACEDRSRAILNGCDTEIFYPRDRAEARRTLALEADAEIVLYVGRFDLRKGLLELIEAVSRLRLTRPLLHCFLIGDGPDRAVMLEAIERHAVGDRITLVAPCNTTEVADWMAAADLVTLPSYNEGCPNVVVEALSAGRPVVASRVGGIPELMDDACGRLVPARDVFSLVEGLNQTLNASWDASAISARRSRSWRDVAGELYALLERTVFARR